MRIWTVMHRSLNRGIRLLPDSFWDLWETAAMVRRVLRGNLTFIFIWESMLQSTILKRALIHTGYYDFLNIAELSFFTNIFVEIHIHYVV